MEQLFFSSWSSLLHIAIIGLLGYVALICILRISGNRTLSKMNSFDFIITIALGSTFASSLLQKSVSLADAVFAFTLLVGLQFLITWLSVRSPSVSRLVKSDPVLLYASGDFLRDSMRKAHVTHDEVISGIRQQGYGSLDEVQFVVLESNGKITATGKDSVSRLSSRSTAP